MRNFDYGAELSCGKPVIVSAVGGILKTIKHDKTGLLAEHGNYETLVQSMML